MATRNKDGFTDSDGFINITITLTGTNDLPDREVLVNTKSKKAIIGLRADNQTAQMLLDHPEMASRLVFHVDSVRKAGPQPVEVIMSDEEVAAFIQG